MNLVIKMLRLFSGSSLRAQLLRGGIGSIAIKGGNLVLSLVMSIVLARMLGANGFGIYAYAFATMNLLMIIADAGVPMLLMREVAASHGRGNWGLLRGALIRSSQFAVVVSLIISIIGFLVLWLLRDNVSHDQRYTLFIMLLMLPVLVSGKTIVYAIRGLQHVIVSQAVELIFRPMLALLVIVGIFFYFPLQRTPQVAMTAQFIAVLTMLAIGLFTLRNLLPQPVHSETAEYRTYHWMKSCLPFTLIGGAGIIFSQADIIMLRWFGSNADVGIYRVAVQGAVLVSFGLQAANAVLAPQIARLYAQADMEKLQHMITASARIVLATAIPVAAILIIAGHDVIRWVFGQQYIHAYIPLAIMVIGYVINSIFGSVGFLLNMTGHEKVSARVLWQAAVLNVLLNSILIPLMGMVGAAIASAISLVSWNFLLFIAVRRLLNVNTTAFTIRT